MPVLDLTEFPSALPAYAPVVGLDLGEKTLGVAVSDATRTVASPLETIRKTKFTDDANRLFALMESRGAAGVVVGLPVNSKPSTMRARRGASIASGSAGMTTREASAWRDAARR